MNIFQRSISTNNPLVPTIDASRRIVVLPKAAIVSHIATCSAAYLQTRVQKEVAYYRQGEPEAFLLDTLRVPLIQKAKVQAAKTILMGEKNKAQLYQRAFLLTEIARLLRSFPDKNVAQFLSRGGVPGDVYSPDKDSRESIGSVLQRALEQTSTLRVADIVPTPLSEAGWIDKLMAIVGRSASVTVTLDDDQNYVADAYSSLLKSEAGWEGVGRAMIALAYIEQTQDRDILKYGGDYSSAALAKFISVRLRDYANFFASVWAMEELTCVEAAVTTARSLLAILGEDKSPSSGIGDLFAHIDSQRSGTRVRLASGASQLVDSAIAALGKANGAGALLFTAEGDADSENLINALGLAPQRMGRIRGLPLVPSFPDIVAGAQFMESTLSDNSIAVVKAAVVRLLQKAVAKLTNLSSTLPSLEEASSVLKIHPIPMDMPSLFQPRVLSVADESAIAVGISTVDVDEKGRARDTLLPYMAAPFNYTLFAGNQAAKGPAMRLLSTPNQRFTLPDDLASFAVPISYLEGERALPMLPTLSTLPGADAGIDFLRLLRAYLAADPSSIPCTIAQVAANFIILVKPGLIRDTESEFVTMTALDSSLADLAGFQALLPVREDVVTYGIKTRELIAQNLLSMDDQWKMKAILHPDPRMDVALLPLYKIPNIREAVLEFKYVRYSAGHLTPVPLLDDSVTPWIPAAFSQRPAVNHQFYWRTAQRLAPPVASAYMTGPIRLVIVANAEVGYLDDAVLSASSSPWKRPVEAVAPDAVILLPDVPINEAIPAAITENVESEKI